MLRDVHIILDTNKTYLVMSQLIVQSLVTSQLIVQSPVTSRLFVQSPVTSCLWIALWCIWPAYTTTETLKMAAPTMISPEVTADAAEPSEVVVPAAVYPEAMASAAVSPEVAAHAAEPSEAAVLASAPCTLSLSCRGQGDRF